MNGERTCALVVTYYPPAGAASCVAAVRPQCGRVLVIDNGSPAESLMDLERLAAETDRVELVRNATNVGLATALNQGCRLAAERGFENVLFLDQDTDPFPTMVDDLLAAWRSSPQPERVGVIGSNHYDDLGQLANVPKNGETSTAVPFVVTSGSLSPLRIFGEVGPFRDDFFIDCVDIEFCYRLESRGFRSLLCLKPTMRHCWGTPTRVRILGREIMVSNHSPFRRYFIVRNGTYVATRSLLSAPIRGVVALARLVLNSAFVLLLEDQKWKKARAIVVGVVHGLLGVLGPAPRSLQ